MTATARAFVALAAAAILLGVMFYVANEDPVECGDVHIDDKAPKAEWTIITPHADSDGNK